MLLRGLPSPTRTFGEGIKPTHSAQGVSRQGITHHSDQARGHRRDTDEALDAHRDEDLLSRGRDWRHREGVRGALACGLPLRLRVEYDVDEDDSGKPAASGRI